MRLLAVALFTFAVAAALVLVVTGYVQDDRLRPSQWVAAFCPIVVDWRDELTRIDEALTASSPVTRARVDDVAADVDEATTEVVDRLATLGAPDVDSVQATDAIDEFVRVIESERDEVVEEVALIDEGVEVEEAAAAEARALDTMLEAFGPVRATFDISLDDERLDRWFHQTFSDDCNALKSLPQ